MLENKRRYGAKFLDGPEAGNYIVGLINEPADELLVFRAVYTIEGMLMCATYLPEEKETLPGDNLYRKVSRSDLIDNEDWDGHPNVIAGCAYEHVHTFTEEDASVSE